jgi:hypothetical protein
MHACIKGSSIKTVCLTCLLLRFFEQFSDPRWTPSVLDSKVRDRVNNQRNTGKVIIKRNSSLGRFYAS